MSYDLQITRQAERDIQDAADEAKRISREPNARGYVGMEDLKNRYVMKMVLRRLKLLN